jgi:hypothetical protein
MIRVDGDFTIYVLKAQGKKDDKWFSPNFDHFGSPKGFTASDDCWQKLGIMGTFDKMVGFAAIHEMHTAHPTHSWKLCELSMSQFHRDLAILMGDE